MKPYNDAIRQARACNLTLEGWFERYSQMTEADLCELKGTLHETLTADLTRHLLKIGCVFPSAKDETFERFEQTLLNVPEPPQETEAPTERNGEPCKSQS